MEREDIDRLKGAVSHLNGTMRSVIQKYEGKVRLRGHFNFSHEDYAAVEIEITNIITKIGE